MRHARSPELQFFRAIRVGPDNILGLLSGKMALGMRFEEGKDQLRVCRMGERSSRWRGGKCRGPTMGMFPACWKSIMGSAWVFWSEMRS